MTAPTTYASTGMPFPGATGHGIRIAVVDSGVNPNHPHIIAPTSGVVLDGDTNGECRDDSLGHGTAVTAAIQEKAPASEYFAVKLFDRSLQATSGRLIQAIEKAIDLRVHLINLSLGTPNLDYRPAFELVVRLAEAAGIVMICAHSEGTRPVLPGMLDGILPVDVNWRLPRHAYRLADDSSRYFASGFPRPLPGLSPARNLSGISFAVANMTGLVARACQQMGQVSLHRVNEALTAEASRIAG